MGAATKKAFRTYLNEKYGHEVDRRGALRGATKRAYGDWLYSADKEYFDMAYENWFSTGTDEF